MRTGDRVSTTEKGRKVPAIGGVPISGTIVVGLDQRDLPFVLVQFDGWLGCIAMLQDEIELVSGTSV